MGIGMAHFEGTEYNTGERRPGRCQLGGLRSRHQCGRSGARSPVVEFPDFNPNTLGARGVGEIRRGRSRIRRCSDQGCNCSLVCAISHSFAPKLW